MTIFLASSRFFSLLSAFSACNSSKRQSCLPSKDFKSSSTLACNRQLLGKLLHALLVLLQRGFIYKWILFLYCFDQSMRLHLQTDFICLQFQREFIYRFCLQFQKVHFTFFLSLQFQWVHLQINTSLQFQREFIYKLILFLYSFNRFTNGFHFFTISKRVHLQTDFISLQFQSLKLFNLLGYLVKL